MTSLARHIRVAAAAAVLVRWCADGALAAPTRVQVAPPPVPAVTLGRGHSIAAGGLKFAVAPALGAFAVRRLSAAATVRPLPLVFHAQPVRAVPVLFLPRAGLATALPQVLLDSCAPARRPDLIETLPTSPFDSTSCGRGDGASADRAAPVRSLTPAHKKNALYGPAYSPSNADLH